MRSRGYRCRERNLLAHNEFLIFMEPHAGAHVTVSVICFSIEHCSSGQPARFDLTKRRLSMNQIIYIVGLVVIVLAILSFFGFR